MHNDSGCQHGLLDPRELHAGRVGNRIGNADYLGQSRPAESLHGRAQHRADDSRNDSAYDARLRHRI